VEAVIRQIGLGSGELAPDVVVGDLYASAKGERLLTEGADIYVGDHPGDIEAGRVGRCTCVGVATGPASAAELQAAGADVVLPDLLSFPAWLHAWRWRQGNAQSQDSGDE
jgi:phosphoglycolate phosphatase